MADGAAGGFVTRAFDSMLKECSTWRYNALQSAIRTFLDHGKDQQSNIGETKRASSASSTDSSSTESDENGETEVGANPSTGAVSVAEELKPTSKPASSNGSITAVLANAGHTLGEVEAELVLNPIRLAFKTKNTKIVELALDCLHKLIEYNHLEGDPGIDGGRNAKLLTDILSMVCSCVDSSSPDSTIIQVLKVFLSAVASTKMRVHGEPLLGVIRVCYDIALNSKSLTNQATSKAMLTQMLSIIFGWTETNVVPSNSLEPKESSMENGSNPVVEEVSSSYRNESTMIFRDALSVKQITSTSEVLTLVSGTDIKGLEALLEKAVDLEDGGKVTRGMGPESMSVGQCDALLIFRTLCKMGMKEDNDEIMTKTRILFLELLQGLLEGVSYSFTKNFQFIDSMKAHLSYALLRASVSQSPVISQYATGIFSVLLLRFRESLKAEIGVLFPVIILRPLDGSDLNQKLTVLRVVEKLCNDPQMLVDLYVNYDCDLEAPNFFEQLVAATAKIAQGTRYVDPMSETSYQTGLIKTSSLQGLVNVLKSIVLWEKSHGESQKQNKGKESFEEEVTSTELEELKRKEDSPSNFEKLEAHESTIEAVVSEFNREPGKGIQLLISSGLVEKTPASVAHFLRSTPHLDKAMIGDYLGQHEEFPLAVMHAYVNCMSFSEMKFDIAIREFLKDFRLPGEAQKIDRIIEKFAERYCADNPGLFHNADTAYALAYAVIMLNTDAHNPMVWPKMSKSDFVSMNNLSDANKESAPRELLEEIYDSIIKDEIKLKDDPSGLSKSSKQRSKVEARSHLINILNLALPKRSSSTESKPEKEGIIKQIRAVIKEQGGKRGVFYTSRRIELVCPMMEALGWPLLSSFSVTMGEIDSRRRVALCMEGYRDGVHITHVLGMDTMRHAFLTSLIRYNALHAPRDMRGKNLEALRTLLALCDIDIYFQGSWFAVLECISRLEYTVSCPAMTETVMQESNQISRDAIIQSLRDLAAKPTEKVFVNSIKMPSESVVEFFTALCSVSAEELKQVPPRVFSLQKVVEISYFNMARIRLVWTRIWSVLANHFIFAASHRDEKVAMYAINSLRQLAMKYLERAELANFTFQNDILKPFVVLIRGSRIDSIRRLVVDYIVQMIKSKAGSIKSGWRSVFMIFTAAADDDLEPLVENAFENVEQVILEHFDQVAGHCYMDCVNCLIAFANNKSSHRISLKAIALLRICEDRLAEGLIPGGALKPIDVNADKKFDFTEHYWFPMLSGLSDLTSDPRAEVRNCALEVLFDLLNERGSKFSSPFWENIFQKVLFPIFDNVKENSTSSGDEWRRESSIHSLQLMCNLFSAFYKDVCFMLPQLLSLLLDCATKTDQSVVSISLGALAHLTEVGGHQFSDHDWDTLLKSIRDASSATQPVELLNDFGFENAKHHNVLIRDLENSFCHTVNENGNSSVDEIALDHIKVIVRPVDMEGSEGVPSPSGRSARSTSDGGLRRSQSIGQMIMGNVMDNVFTRSFTSKLKNQTSDVMVSPSPYKFQDTATGPDSKREKESPILGTIRSKCTAQLLLLGAIDSIQKKFWNKLNAELKITVMETVFSVVKFASSYNSYASLRSRMHQYPNERPPLNLLRQEIAGSCIYLDILLKTTASVDMEKEEQVKDEKLEALAEEKLVSYCEQVLKEASDFQSTVEETTIMDVHRVLELRSPILVKVLKGICEMNMRIFKNHLSEFYPLITKLVCCDQADVRSAVSELFRTQLKTLLP